jgi:glycosyltransferase involved in cell wall biosynthesis
VGIAPDLLDPACLYRYPYEAVATILADIRGGSLAETVDANARQAQTAYVPEAAARLFHQLYGHWQAWPAYRGPQAAAVDSPVRAEQFRPRPTGWKQRIKYQLRRNPVVARLWRTVIRPQLDRRRRAALRAPAQTSSRPGQAPAFTAGLWHDFRPPPYGGGNQFMLALRAALLAQNVQVVDNQVGAGIDAYLLNSVQFDVESFAELQAKQPLAIVHRIDGPIFLVRGKDREQDDLCFHLNACLASATVLQSYWTYQRTLELGYRPVNPIVVHNAVDPAIFHARGRIAFSRDRKIRLISSSWSDNPRKGGPLYKWIEQHLDWDRFDYTFVGRASEQFQRIRTVEPVPSADLADLLRQHDIYITASQNDPCSNALIEALACGLPALYLDDGGHPELVGQGGLPFQGPGDVLAQLDRLVEHYAAFQNLIAVPPMDDIARRYLMLLQQAAAQAGARR